VYVLLAVLMIEEKYEIAPVVKHHAMKAFRNNGSNVPHVISTVGRHEWNDIHSLTHSWS
jgi:hypothetical protein